MIQKSNYVAPSAELVEIRTDGELLKASDKSGGVENAIYHGNEGWD